MSQSAKDGRADCSHIPEPHVVYDREAAGWRAKAGCRCGDQKGFDTRLYVTLGDAERAAGVLLKQIGVMVA